MHSQVYCLFHAFQWPQALTDCVRLSLIIVHPQPTRRPSAPFRRVSRSTHATSDQGHPASHDLVLVCFVASETDWMLFDVGSTAVNSCTHRQAFCAPCSVSSVPVSRARAYQAPERIRVLCLSFVGFGLGCVHVRRCCDQIPILSARTPLSHMKHDHILY